jgi:predicted DNA-binding protein with PD1-like motif
MEKGEEIMDSIYKIINKYDIVSGWINGIRAMENIRIGSYNINKKAYYEVDFK